MRKPTPKELVDAFTNNHAELYLDICRYSSQTELPMTAWFLDSNFKSVQVYRLGKNENDNPFMILKKLVDREQPIAYVLCGLAAMVKRVLKTGKSTDSEIDSSLEDDQCDEAECQIAKSEGDVLNDPKKFETVIVATSRLDIPDLKFGQPELIRKGAIDSMKIYKVTRTNADVDLQLEADMNANKIGNNNIVNVLGENFGLRRK